MKSPETISPANLPDFTSGDLRQEPLPRAETIPSTWYTTDTFLEFERQVLFPQFWQLGVHDSQLPAFYYFLFPNMMLNILPNRMQTNIIRPVTESKTEVALGE